ncbi:MAG: ANTAR domain-containing response regulator [Tepidisphaeraceae bacterium]
MAELKTRRVLIVEDDTLVGMGLASQLKAAGHDVVGQAANALEAAPMFQERQPDLVIVDVRLNAGSIDGIELAAQLLKERRVPMIVVSAYSDPELVARAGAAGVFGYLVKPVSQESLAAQIEVAVTRFNDHETIAREKEALAQNLENRKVIERAKGILMKRAGLDEAEAHKRLQQESQKRRVSIVELAKKVIESEQLLGGS